MNRFALLSLYRSLVRHKLFAALNIGGLAVGIAVFLVLGLYVRFETSYEKWLPEYRKIYVVQTIWNMPESPFNGPSNWTMGGLLDQLREDFPGVVGTRIRTGGTVVQGRVATSEDVVRVDPDFFRVFDLPLVRGSRDALRAPTNVLISEKMARKYFGGADPVGRSITIAMDDVASYRVAGVFKDLPDNSELKITILLPLPRTPPAYAAKWWNHWGSTSLQTFLRFDTPQAASAFTGKMPGFTDRRALADMGKDASKSVSIGVMPIEKMHLEPEGQASASRKLTMVTLGLVGILTLVIAIVNYVNLATARSGLRAREVAMRKVLGASRSALIAQFLGEAILTVAIAALGGLILAEIALPLVNSAGGLRLAIPYLVVVPALTVLALIVGCLAGVYPAVLLSRFPAASVLASARAPGGGRAGTRVREALVVFQFGLAIAFMIGTLILVAQTRHVRSTDLGFRRDGLLVVQSIGDSMVDAPRRRAVLEAIRRLPGVTSATLGDSAVGGSGQNNADNVPLPGVPGDGPSLRRIGTGPDFFKTYGTRLIAGRFFDDQHRGDDVLQSAKGQPNNIIINRRALSTLRFTTPEDAVGKTVGGDRPRTIIGVVDDMRFFSPRAPNDATYYTYYGKPEDNLGGSAATIRFQGDPRAMTAAVRHLWQQMVPNVPFDAATAEKKLEEFYEADDRATRLFGIGAGLAVLIGCVGLWGLASFNTARRTKEIGIRKTLGASATDIVKLLVGQFLRPVLIANLVAWPLAFVAMRTWLAGFEDRITLSPFYFAAATAVALTVAVLTVLGQSLKASRAAPAWALRHD
ncbi:ABC transporter permease [Sphingomonas sp. SORGH_AS_0879]|uniref:ABC transporter permease n=1 Tax=Sphingomonas sp. SORGH_AS_0879 TaxID=3041790 RepID=UPI002787CA56|nr:ABC transporter permease [Sphingomonas sp. SORGH_AS_0879]MDQ1231362.1 putative ABC transport system permease protein [Sphingomonas sp. SORGH_AS_0879]